MTGIHFLQFKAWEVQDQGTSTLSAGGILLPGSQIPSSLCDLTGKEGEGSSVGPLLSGP